MRFSLSLMQRTPADNPADNPADMSAGVRRKVVSRIVPIFAAKLRPPVNRLRRFFLPTPLPLRSVDVWGGVGPGSGGRGAEAAKIGTRGWLKVGIFGAGMNGFRTVGGKELDGSESRHYN